jgi:hypothetical protein
LGSGEEVPDNILGQSLWDFLVASEELGCQEDLQGGDDELELPD